MRASAPALLSVVGARRLAEVLAEFGGMEAVSGAGGAQSQLAELEAHVRRLAADPAYLPAGAWEKAVDYALAAAAIDTAVQRHAGWSRELIGPGGRHRLQYGKDLRQIRNLIGTGGVLVHASRPQQLLAAALFKETAPNMLRPLEPSGFIDRSYLLAPLGLLAEIEPSAAYKLLRRHLTSVGQLVPAARQPDKNKF